MAKRSKLSFNGSRKLFRATADKVHRQNLNTKPMRGGTRL